MKLWVSITTVIASLSLATVAFAQTAQSDFSATVENKQSGEGDSVLKLSNGIRATSNGNHSTLIQGNILWKFAWNQTSPPPKKVAALKLAEIYYIASGQPKLSWPSYETIEVPRNGIFSVDSNDLTAMNHNSPGYGVQTSFGASLRGIDIVRPSGYTERSGDGTLKSHTIYSSIKRLVDGQEITDFPSDNWVDFTGNYWGEWHVITSFSWSPQFSGASYRSNRNKMPYSGMMLLANLKLSEMEPGISLTYKWSGTPKSIENRSITLQASDVHGALDTDHILHIHEKYENIDREYHINTIIEESPFRQTFVGPIFASEGRTASFTRHMGGDWGLSLQFPLKWVGFDIGRTQAASEYTETINVPPIPAGRKVTLFQKRTTQYWTFYYDEYDENGRVWPHPPLLKHIHTAQSNVGTQFHWHEEDYDADPGLNPGIGSGVPGF